ncbi:MAG: class I SAM-dependent methyltransferase [Candidatus Omnitrophota bacterium]|jgi:SAM-dependent methyltransferase
MEKNKSYFIHDRGDLLAIFPECAKKVLEIGCGAGILGEALKGRGAEEVIGVEKDRDSCISAGKRLDRALCLDAETDEMPFNEGYFDCIIYGDVVEHFNDPWGALKKHKRFLKEGGIMLASIPNIRYYKVLIRLLAGTWDYTDAGILDRSHIRFFALINIRELFEDNGFSITSIRRNIVASRGFRILNFLLFGALKDFLTYQYYVIARYTGKGFHKRDSRKQRPVYKF